MNMMVIGSWTLKMGTPIGEQTATLSVIDADGELAATMTGADGGVQAIDAIEATGNTLTWKIAVKKPIPLTLHFKVAVDGDSLSGTVRPGIFPPSTVRGVRV